MMHKPYTDKRFNLKAYLEEKRKLINAKLDALLGCAGIDSRLCRAMAYSLLASGKRLRPVLTMAAAEAVAEVNEEVVRAACAIEMIHAYSLIHDDLPAMDDDDLRRGQPTCHVKFDEATAILAGDALLTLAFEILAGGDENESQPARKLDVIRTVARAAGYQGMIEGQMRDMAAEGQALALDPLKRLHAMKTGALIKAAVSAGAILAGGSTDQIDAVLKYADNIGLAFQVTDDILNVKGDPDQMGKASGTDQARGKSTYPALMGLERSEAYAGELIRDALHAIEIFDARAQPLSALSFYIIERNR